MRKLLFFLCALLTGVSTMWADNESVKLTFNRTGTDASSVTVNVAGVTGATATFEELSEYGLIDGTTYMTSGILCPDVNRNAGPTIRYQFTITGLPTNFTFNTVGLFIHAFSTRGNGYQESEGRTWSIDIDADDADFANNPDLDICEGKVFQNNHEIKSETPKTTGGTLKLLFTIERATTNTSFGCFFGLESITLSNVQTTDVTYHLMYNGTQIGEGETVEAQIGSAPSIPSLLQRDYCTLACYSDETCTQPIETITAETANIYVKAEVQESELPFELSTNVENAKWYYLYGQSTYGWAIYIDGDAVKNQGSEYAENAYLWAFLGNPVEGIKVINKAETGKYLQSNSTATQGDNVTMGTEEQVWILQKKSEEGQFLLYNGSLWFNANQDGNMKYWNGNGAGSTLWVYEPTDVTLKVDGDAHYATFIAPFRVAVPEEVTAYQVTGVEENEKTLVLTKVEGTIPANTPVVLYSESEVNTTLTGPNTATQNTYTSGLLTGVYTETAAPVGSYVLQNQNNVVAFYHVEEGQQPQVEANHAYLTYTGAIGVNDFRFGNDDATGIEAVEGNQKDKAVIYDLTGRRVEKAVNGLYIINGKKVVIK